jgi:hypothetical protein
VLFGGPAGSVAVDTGYFAPEGAYRQPGLPSHLFNFLAKYQIPTSYGTFGAVLGVNMTGPYFLDYNGYIVVPWQYEMDLSFLYKSKNDRFEAKLALLNLTDQKIGHHRTRSMATTQWSQNGRSTSKPRSHLSFKSIGTKRGERLD